MHAPKIRNDLKILTDDEVKDFEVINFAENSKSTREKMYSKLSEEKNLVESFYIFVITPVEKC